MATNNFVFWLDGLEGWAFDHHRRNGGGGICQQKLPAWPGIWLFFKCPGVCPGGLPGGDARACNWLTFQTVITRRWPRNVSDKEHRSLSVATGLCSQQVEFLYNSFIDMKITEFSGTIPLPGSNCSILWHSIYTAHCVNRWSKKVLNQMKVWGGEIL